MSDNRKNYPNEDLKELQVIYQSAKIFKEIIKEEETFEEIEVKLLEQWDKKVALQSRILNLKVNTKKLKRYSMAGTIKVIHFMKNIKTVWKV